MCDLGTWLFSLISNLQHWLSGGGVGGTAILLLLLMERFSKFTMSKKWYFIIFIVFFIIGSSFVTWKDKNDELIAIQNKLKSPQFNGQIEGYQLIASSKSVTLIMEATIKNPFGPPSALTNWKMTIKFPDGHIINGKILPLTGKDLKISLKKLKGAPPKAAFIYPPGKYLPDVSSQPIPAGGLCGGWFWTQFKKDEFDKVYEKGASIELEFWDILSNKKHVLEEVMGKDKTSPYPY